MKKFLSLLLALLLTLSLCACGGGTGSTGSVSEQYAKLETAQWQKLVDTLTSNTSTGTSNLAASGAMDITLGDSLLSLLGGAIPEGVDLTWLKKFSLSYDLQSNGDLMKEVIGLGLNGKNIVSMDVVADMATSVLYVALPEWSNKYIKLDASAMGGGADSTVGAVTGNSIMNMLESLNLPQGKEMNSLLMKYIQLAYKGMTDVTKEKAPFTVNGTDFTFTAYTCKITEKIATDILISVLTEAKKDATIKGMLPDSTGYEASIDALLTALQADTDYDTTSVFHLVTYVDGQNNIVGRKLALIEGDTTTVDVQYFVANGKTEFTLSADGYMISFRGKKNNYQLSMTTMGQEITLLNIKTTGNEKKGTLTITPTEFITQSIFAQPLEFSLELSWDSTTANAKVGIDAYLNKSLLLGIQISGKETTPGNITVPSDTVDPNNQAALQSWLATINIETLLNRLVDAGVPQSLFGALLG